MMRTALVAVLMAGLSSVVVSGTAHAQLSTVDCGPRGTVARLETVLLTANQSLLCYREGSATVRNFGPVLGLATGESLVGIDYRPANGVLYGVGNLGGIYTVAAQGSTAIATRVSGLVDMTTAAPVQLAGFSFGVDFNPVPDRLRIISNFGQNLRVNVDNGQTTTDGSLNIPTFPGVVALGSGAVAYTNNDASAATGTVLYSLNNGLNQLLIQAPPNAGTQNPVGALNFDIDPATGFDIFSVVQNGTTQSVRGLASMVTTAMGGAVTTQIYSINLTTGAATPAANGNFSNVGVVGLAIPLVQGTGN